MRTAPWDEVDVTDMHDEITRIETENLDLENELIEARGQVEELSKILDLIAC